MRQWRFSGSCARHSIRHLLLCLGQSPDQNELREAIGKSRIDVIRQGIDEEDIKRVLKHFGWQPLELYVSHRNEMRKKLEDCLAAGRPVIVCLDKWDHWAVIVGKSKTDYVFADSDKKKVIGTISWKKLESRLRFEEEEKPYYGLSVRAKLDSVHGSLVPRMGQLLPYLRNKRIKKEWGRLMYGLKSHFSGGELSASAFFSTHEKTILTHSGQESIQSLKIVQGIVDSLKLRASSTTQKESLEEVIRWVRLFRDAKAS